MRLVPQPSEIINHSGVCFDSSKAEYVLTNDIIGAESYIAEISCSGIKIYASTERGLFYGKMTIKQLRIIYPNAIPCMTIKDSPRFGYRGFMLDCARHIISVDEIKKLIDLAALLKFNTFHWHLSDDQGFRIESDIYPELTKYGSVRHGDNFGAMCRSDEDYGGYYTKKEIKEIISYCSDRFIEIIPELDIPGHTSAILHVFPQFSCRKQPIKVKNRQGIYKDNICIGNEEAKNFIKSLLDEICDIFPGKYIHIGGDEAPDTYRANCPLCQKVLKDNGLSSTAELQCIFANEMAEYLKKKGRQAIVWNDILKGKSLNSSIIAQRWLDKDSLALKNANNGRKTIISDFKPYYFDYPYGMYSLKDVYKFNPTGHKKLSPSGKENIIGVETPVWTEFINNPSRLEYMIIPRWFAVAESAWSRESDKNYADFKHYAVKLAEALKSTGYSPADVADWDMSAGRRITDTLSFFKKFLSK